MNISNAKKLRLVTEARFVKMSSWASNDNKETNVQIIANAITNQDWDLVAEKWVSATGDSELEHLDEGWADKLKSGFNNVKNKAKSAARKVKNVAKGSANAALSGFGKNTTGTNVGGEEVLDAAEREKRVKASLSKAQQAIAKSPDVSSIPGADSPAELLQDLLTSGFPNKNAQAFKTGVIAIEDSYENIVKAFKAKTIDHKAANLTIQAYRTITNHFADFKMNDKGAYLNEEEPTAPDAFDTETDGLKSKNMDSLYSKKLPMGLALSSLALLGSGIALDTPFAQKLLQSMKDPNIQGVKDVLVQSKEKMSALFAPGEGLTQAFERMTNITMDPSQPISNFMQNKEMTNLLLQGTQSPDIAKNILSTALEQNPSMTMADLFKNASQIAGTGQLQGDIFKIANPNPIISVITTGMKKVATSTAPNTLKNKALQSLSTLGPAFLKGLGLSGLVAAAASASMRAKGKSYKNAKQSDVDALGGNSQVSSVLAGKSGSRMATLDALEKKLQYVKPEESEKSPAAAPAPAPVAAAPAAPAAAPVAAAAPAAPAPAPAAAAAPAAAPAAPDLSSLTRNQRRLAQKILKKNKGMEPQTAIQQAIAATSSKSQVGNDLNKLTQNRLQKTQNSNSRRRPGPKPSKPRMGTANNLNEQILKNTLSVIKEVFQNNKFEERLLATTELKVVKKKIYERIIKRSPKSLTHLQKRNIAKYINKRIYQLRENSKKRS